MGERTFTRHPIRQVAFYVPDARKAALAHSAAFGSGPFFVTDHIPLAMARYRGQPCRCDLTSARGQWGNIMVEMVQINGDEPTIFTELSPDGRAGLHHVALIVDDLVAAMELYSARGFPEAFYAESKQGGAFAMMDATQQFGHFIELYEPRPGLLRLYHEVQNAALDFDGTDVVREWKM